MAIRVVVSGAGDGWVDMLREVINAADLNWWGS